jgi:hypothetical protein
MNYNLRCVQSYAKTVEVDPSQEAGDAISAVPSCLQKSSANDVNRATSIVIPSQEATETFDIDSFLDQLGPRYKDWSGRSPIPVDADLLPGLVPGYKPPFRQLPYRTKISLKDKEMTALRRLARQTTPHFALGTGVELFDCCTYLYSIFNYFFPQKNLQLFCHPSYLHVYGQGETGNTKA